MNENGGSGVGSEWEGGLTAAVDNIIAQHIPVCRPLVVVSDVSVYKHSRHPLYPCTPPRNVENGERLTGLDSCSRSPGSTGVWTGKPRLYSTSLLEQVLGRPCTISIAAYRFFLRIARSASDRMIVV